MDFTIAFTVFVVMPDGMMARALLIWIKLLKENKELIWIRANS
jgi:hypothetical protein